MLKPGSKDIQYKILITGQELIELKKFTGGMCGAFCLDNRSGKSKFTDLSGHKTYWLDFRRDKNTGKGTEGPLPLTRFRIKFKKEVKGPITLGFGAHFGLGLLIPDQS